MNYSKIYKKLCERGKLRSKKDLDYLEKHHIVPVFFFKNNKRKLRHNDGIYKGDGNHPNNICYLTPREHFIAHILLCKIWANTKWYHRCRSSLMLFFNKSNSTHIRYSHFKPGLTKKYEKYAKLARESISKERKGKMPAKDVNTNEIIGSVSVNHPNVISGKWVHHSKNTTLSDERKRNVSKLVSGYNNPRSLYSDKELEDSYIKCCNIHNRVVSHNFWVWYSRENNMPYITSFKSFRFDGSKFDYLKNLGIDNGYRIAVGDKPFHTKEYKNFLKENQSGN